MSISHNNADVNKKSIDQSSYYERLRAIPSEQRNSIIRCLLAGRITREQGNTLSCDCPNHASQSHESLHCELDKGTFYCHACAKGGDILHLVEFVQSGTVTKHVSGSMPESHRRARDWLAAQIGLPPLSQVGQSQEEIEKAEQERLNAERAFNCLTLIAGYYHQRLMNLPEQRKFLQEQYALSDETLEHFKVGFSENGPGEDLDGHEIPGLPAYLKARGFADDEILSTGLFTYRDHNSTLVPFFSRRYTFPYWRNGLAVYAIARKSPWTENNEHETAKYKKALTCTDRHPYVCKAVRNDELFNETNLLSKSTDYVIVAEGVTDALACLQAGFPTISPVTVRPKKGDWERLVKRFKSAGVKTVYLVGDNEISHAGQRGAESSARQLETAGIEARIVTLPLGEQQLAARETLKTYGIEPGAKPERIKMIREQVGSEKAPEINGLIAKAKIDLNDYFKDYTANDFQQLLKQAPTRLEAIILPYWPTLANRKRNPDLLKDEAFLKALADAYAHDAVLYEKTVEQIEGRKKQFIKAMQRYIETRPEGEPLVTALRDALLQLEGSTIRVPPEHEAFELPGTFNLSEQGIVWVKTTPRGIESKLICPALAYIARRVQDIHTNEVRLELQWYEKGRWHALIAARDCVFDSHKLVRLAGHGLPVGSDNSGTLAKYFLDFEARNIEKMNTDRVSSQCGWIDEACRTFLLGEALYGEPGTTFQPSDTGDQQIGFAFRCAGDPGTWRSLVDEALNYSHAAAMMYASLAAPLIRLLGCGGFVVDMSAPSSSGKTIALRLAASIYGNPNERTDHAMVHTWDSTAVAQERICRVSNDLPIFFDDTKTASSLKRLGKAAYDLVRGQSRLRGSIRGLQSSHGSRNLILSTGEAALADYAPDGGARGRILSIKGAPFGGTGQRTRELVARINATVCHSYGHAGPLWIQFILDHREEWPSWQSRYHQLANARDARTGFEGRFADIQALIVLAGQLAHEAGIMPGEFRNAFDVLADDIAEDIINADIGKRALESVYDWCCANEESFYGRHEHAGTKYDGTSTLIEKTPARGWSGLWRQGDYEFIGFHRHVLKQALESLGFDPEAVFAAWKDHDWLIRNGRHLTTTGRIGRNMVRLMKIKKTAIAEVMGFDPCCIDEECKARGTASASHLTVIKGGLLDLSRFDEIYEQTVPATDEEYEQMTNMLPH